MNKSVLMLMWLVGVILIAISCYRLNRPIIEGDIQSRTSEALASGGFSWVSVEAYEQTVRLIGTAPDLDERSDLNAIANAIYGVTDVDNRVILSELSRIPSNAKAGNEDRRASDIEIEECQIQFDDAFSSDSIEFKTESSEIRSSSHSFLDRLSEIAKECAKVFIDVEGHTDSDGPADSNLRLSDRRANEVANALVDRGVQRDMLQALGYGEVRPVGDNKTKEGKAINRRIEFKVRGS